MSKAFYSGVPKRTGDNLRYRGVLRDRAKRSTKFQRELVEACRRDLLFWVNAFVWTYDPRITKTSKIVPFITYPFQDEALRKMQGALGVQDIGIEKSRDTGASWITLLLLDHQFLFHPLNSFTIASRNEKLVDKSNEPDSLFWKLDFIHKHLPLWMLPKIERRNLQLTNLTNGSTIGGTSTTSELGRGGRKTAVFLDEFAAFELRDGFEALKSTQYNTRCRIFNSTHKGTGTAHYLQINLPTTLKLRFHWSQHPIQMQGLYTTDNDNGHLKVLDKGYRYPDDYRFILDGKTRSPYYDYECSRTPIPSQIAEELDIDPTGAESRFIAGEVIEQLIEDYALRPLSRGTLDEKGVYKKDEPGTVPVGKLALWFEPDHLGQPPLSTYTMGVDIAAGGASNSAIVVYDDNTFTQVAEYADNDISPDELAEFASWLGKWLGSQRGGNAYLIWEANGRGQEFGRRIERLGYGPIWYRRIEDTTGKKVTDKMGWWSDRATKRSLLHHFAQAMLRGQLVTRSEVTIRELGHYKNAGTHEGVVHSKAEAALDPTGMKESHGDLAIAAGVAWHRMATLVSGRASEKKLVIPDNCAYRRREEYLKSLKKGPRW